MVSLCTVTASGTHSVHEPMPRRSLGKPSLESAAAIQVVSVLLSSRTATGKRGWEKNTHAFWRLLRFDNSYNLTGQGKRISTNLTWLTRGPFIVPTSSHPVSPPVINRLCGQSCMWPNAIAFPFFAPTVLSDTLNAPYWGPQMPWVFVRCAKNGN